MLGMGRPLRKLIPKSPQRHRNHSKNATGKKKLPPEKKRESLEFELYTAERKREVKILRALA